MLLICDGWILVMNLSVRSASLSYLHYFSALGLKYWGIKVQILSLHRYLYHPFIMTVSFSWHNFFDILLNCAFVKPVNFFSFILVKWFSCGEFGNCGKLVGILFHAF